MPNYNTGETHQAVQALPLQQQPAAAWRAAAELLDRMLPDAIAEAGVDSAQINLLLDIEFARPRIRKLLAEGEAEPAVEGLDGLPVTPRPAKAKIALAYLAAAVHGFDPSEISDELPAIVCFGESGPTFRPLLWLHAAAAELQEPAPTVYAEDLE